MSLQNLPCWRSGHQHFDVIRRQNRQVLRQVPAEIQIGELQNEREAMPPFICELL